MCVYNDGWVIPDSGVGGASDYDPLIILQTQHRACMTCQNLQTLQRLLVPDLHRWREEEKAGERERVENEE